MNNKNEHDTYIIPPNFIDSGTFFRRDVQGEKRYRSRGSPAAGGRTGIFSWPVPYRKNHHSVPDRVAAGAVGIDWCVGRIADLPLRTFFSVI